MQTAPCGLQEADQRRKAVGWSAIAGGTAARGSAPASTAERAHDDLGRSATGVVGRSSFERLLAAACAEEAGAIFAVEASRLARNGREWCTLLELCAVVDTVLIDTEAVYDPRSTSERLPLGLNGALSEPDWSVGVCGQVLIVEDVSSGGSCA